MADSEIGQIVDGALGSMRPSDVDFMPPLLRNMAVLLRLKSKLSAAILLGGLPEAK